MNVRYKERKKKFKEAPAMLNLTIQDIREEFCFQIILNTEYFYDKEINH